MKFADLHLHTVFSDGTYTPEDLVSRSVKAGLSCIAVADHDTVSAVELTSQAAKGKDIEVLSAVELSADHMGREIHILGYLVNHKDSRLLGKLDFLRKMRVERVYKIVSKLNGLGIALRPESVFSLAGEGTVGRLHIARALVKEGFENSLEKVFQKYIGDNGPAYVCDFRLNPKEAIDLIKSAGGIPVLAHPYSLNNDELIAEFAKSGLMGLEVYYPEHSQGMINLYLDLAKKNHLLITGGSDCHGSAKPSVRIGCIKLAYEFVEKLKAAKENL